MGKILIGTSGYSYEDWIGNFYPKGTEQKDFLKLYAEEFNIVELNFTYYRLPEVKTIDKILNITTDKFQFAVKAHKSLTHEISGDPHIAAANFKEGILPMIKSTRLAAILLQFPYSFHYTIENRKYLHNVCSEFEGLPLAIEFRNRKWLKNSVYENLQKLGIALVSVDEPDLPGLLKPTDRVTSSFSYIRFHGRNKDNWWKGDNKSRYDYLYNDQELMEWLPRIKSMAIQTKTLFVFFNNHWKGQAIQNANRLKELLKEK